MHKKSRGFTLIELLITITISGMVLLYAAALFTGLGKGFRMQAAQNSRVQNMILQKKRIESCLGEIGSIDKSWSVTSIKCKKRHTDSLFTIQFRNGLLTENNRIVCEKVKDFRFDLVESGEDKVLLWECLSEKSGFICGAVVIRE